MKARLVPQLMLCQGCENEWREPILYDVSISVWSEFVKNLRCPNCGADWRRLSFKAEGRRTKLLEVKL